MMPDASPELILVFDYGTTSIRACLMDKAGQIVAQGQAPLPQVYPGNGWVEQDPKKIWSLSATVANLALQQAKTGWENIAAIGVTNQRETTILWDVETGEPVYNAIVWQCRRTTDFCEQLKSAGHEKLINQKTGLVLDPYFSATKIRWILDSVPLARQLQQQGRLRFGTVDTWALWHLSGQKLHMTDYTNASRTMLYNIVELGWDQDLLALFGVSETMLPTVKESSGLYGMSDPEFTGGRQIPLAAAIGDQQAALYGQKCWQPGQAKSTYGTGAFLVMHTGEQPVFSKNGMLTTLAADADGQVAYALEGAIFIAGGAIEWLQKKLRIIEDLSQLDSLAHSLPHNEGVYFIPAFTGLGAPYWKAHTRGTITGLTQDSGPAHFVRAALEAMGYQTREVLEAMLQDANQEIAVGQHTPVTLSQLRIDGGVSRCPFLRQFLADMLQTPIVSTDDAEITAKGAGYLAGLAVGYWDGPEDIAALAEVTTRQTPGTLMNEGMRAKYYQGWRQAMKKALL